MHRDKRIHPISSELGQLLQITSQLRFYISIQDLMTTYQNNHSYSSVTEGRQQQQTEPLDLSPTLVTKEVFDNIHGNQLCHEETQSPKTLIEALHVSIKKQKIEIAREARDKHFKDIYDENHRRASSNPIYSIIPLFNQPRDMPPLRDERNRHEGFKKKLVTHLEIQARERRAYEQIIIKEYEEKRSKWIQIVEERERNNADDYREFFEETFPHLKKNKTSNKPMEVTSRKLLDEQNTASGRRRNSVLVPPMLLCANQRLVYQNTNSRIDDLHAEYYSNREYWSPEEHDLFKKMLTENGKNFPLIARHFPNKSCIEHYYLTKNKEKFKEFMPKLRGTKKANALFSSYNTRQKRALEIEGVKDGSEDVSSGPGRTRAKRSAMVESHATPEKRTTVLVSSSEGNNGNGILKSPGAREKIKKLKRRR